MAEAKYRSLVEKFEHKIRQGQKDMSAKAEVGYSAMYANRVHNSIGMALKGKPRPSGIGNYWDPNGQALWLQIATATLTNNGSTQRLIRKELRSGKTMSDALLQAVRKILQLANTMVPVEYGNLLASGFARVIGYRDRAGRFAKQPAPRNKKGRFTKLTPKNFKGVHKKSKRRKGRKK